MKSIIRNKTMNCPKRMLTVAYQPFHLLCQTKMYQYRLLEKSQLCIWDHFKFLRCHFHRVKHRRISALYRRLHRHQKRIKTSLKRNATCPTKIVFKCVSEMAINKSRFNCSVCISSVIKWNCAHKTVKINFDREIWQRNLYEIRVNNLCV